MAARVGYQASADDTTANPVKQAPAAFIDQVTFSFQDDFERSPALRRLTGGSVALTHEQVIRFHVAPIVEEIFGHRVTVKRKGGWNGYQESYQIGDPAAHEEFGTVAIGGNRETICVALTAKGIQSAAKGWQARAVRVAKRLTRCHITRADVAVDDLTGETYSVDRAKDDYVDGRFITRGAPPDCDQRGNWLRPNGSGRTFYVGKRGTKLLRVYEKGKQLGDPNSPWVRVELELHNKDRVIPWDILENPGPYLSGAYPKALSWVDMIMERIEVIKKEAEITYDALVGHARRTYGRLIGTMVEVEGTVEAVVSRLFREGVPSRLAAVSHRRSDYVPVLSFAMP